MKRLTSKPKPRLRVRRSEQAEHLCRALQRLWSDYEEKHASCLAHCGRDSVHRLRVSTRRLLAHLDIVRRVGGHEELGKARRVMKQRFELLAALRDLQVQLDLLAQHLRSMPELKPLAESLEAELAREFASSAKVLEKSRRRKFGQLMIVVTSRLATAVAASGADRRHAAAIREALLERHGLVRRRHKAANGNAEGVHRTRVAMKKYRYLLEALRPMLSRFKTARFQGLVDFQDVTGELHDIQLLNSRMDVMSKRGKLDSWRTRRFREVLARRSLVLDGRYQFLSRRLFSDNGREMVFSLKRP